MKAEHDLEKDTNAILCMARTVTYALRSGLNEKLHILQDKDIIKPVASSKWVTPIYFQLLKPIKEFIHIQGVFKNCKLIFQIGKIAFVMVKDILAELRGDLHFTNADLKQEYLQLKVDEKSQELLINNKHSNRIVIVFKVTNASKKKKIGKGCLKIFNPELIVLPFLLITL